MKANATSVSTDLGGGANGNLGLMVIPVEYINTPVIPYVRSIHPGVLNVPPGTTQHESTRLRDEFKEEISQYRECIQVEKSLSKQLGCALPQLHLRGFKKNTQKPSQQTFQLFWNISSQLTGILHPNN